MTRSFRRRVQPRCPPFSGLRAWTLVSGNPRGGRHASAQTITRLRGSPRSPSRRDLGCPHRIRDPCRIRRHFLAQRRNHGYDRRRWRTRLRRSPITASSREVQNLLGRGRGPALTHQHATLQVFLFESSAPSLGRSSWELVSASCLVDCRA